MEGNEFGVIDKADIALFDDLPIDPEARARSMQRKVLARAMRTRSRIATRRATSEAVLQTLLPPLIEVGDCWHVISGGDIDSLSYVAHFLTHAPYHQLTISTWCMAYDDVQQLATWLHDGRLTKLDVYAGEIFPSQYAAAHDALCNVVRQHGGRVAVFRNHSKVTLMASPTAHLVIESSANVNTNPRTEQTTITHDAKLHAFYTEFFNGVRSFSRNFDDLTLNGRQNA